MRTPTATELQRDELRAMADRISQMDRALRDGPQHRERAKLCAIRTAIESYLNWTVR